MQRIASWIVDSSVGRALTARRPNMFQYLSADEMIMGCVIGLVVWAFAILPLVYSYQFA